MSLLVFYSACVGSLALGWLHVWRLDGQSQLAKLPAYISVSRNHSHENLISEECQAFSSLPRLKMASQFEKLPPEIIAQILASNSSFDIITLWICGNRLLQTKIERNATSITLVGRQSFLNRRLPSILTKLRALKAFRLITSVTLLHAPYSIIETLKQLSKSLSDLEIVLADLHSPIMKSWTFTSRNPDISRLPPSERTVILLKELFEAHPNLKSLTMDGYSILNDMSFQHLPPTLETLCIPRYYSLQSYGEYFPQLPRTLTSLHLQSNVLGREADFALLPPTLTSFISSMHIIDLDGLLAHLPRTLVRFEVASVHQFFLSSLTEASTPPSLQTLKFVYSGDESPSSNLLNPIVLPLETLDCSNIKFNILAIRALPSTLTHLSGLLDFDSVQKSDWPPRLTRLSAKFVTFNFPPETAAHLPPHLTSLTLGNDCFSGAFIDFLPRSITELRVLIGDFRHTSCYGIFPPSLQIYETVHLPQETLIRLPHTLTELNCNGTVLDTDLIHLNFPALKILKLRVTRHTTPIDPLDTGYLARARQLRIEGLSAMKTTGKSASVIEDTFGTKLFDLLPRTLETLEFRIEDVDGSELAPQAWSRLPPNLTSLRVYHAIHADCLFYIPRQCLKFLYLRLKHLSKAHMKACPKNLKYFALTEDDSSNHYSSFARHIPYYVNFGYDFALAELQSRRLSAFERDARDELRELSPSNIDD